MAAYAALASLSQTTDLTINKHSFVFSVGTKEKIRSIHNCVIFLLSFLENSQEKAKSWEGKMRDVARETEDIIDGFVSNSKRVRVKFEDELGYVLEKMCLMAEDMMDEPPGNLPASVSSSSSSRVAPTGNDAVIGLADDLMEMKERLCGMSSKLQIIPIMGMGGIGKTTLATSLYHDPLIIEYFHIRVWLTISQDYRVGKVLLGLLDSIKQQMCLGVKDSMELVEEEDEVCREEIDYFTMEEDVYKNLKGRRYLIVMDDVWSTKVWDGVRDIFPNDCNGSRIMLTTRLADLAAYPGSSSPSHEMRFMNDCQSWNLLKGKVFANSNCPPELEDVGKEIAGKCAGLPLAVVLVAGFLSAVDETLSSWKGIAKNVNPIIDQESGGILSLSYTQLPHHLRPCFLYLGAYPEDEKIRVSRLTRLWVAEGFLKHQNGCNKSLEEKAEEYLMDLVKRNLVVVNSRKSDGKIKYCSLHDMVRDLCIRKAHEEKFLRVMYGHVDVPQRIVDERRISLNTFSNISSNCCPTIRTILSFQEQLLLMPVAFLQHVRLLRVFDAMGDNTQVFPYEVYGLFHLRYLALKLHCNSNISSAISSLTKLQTLIIFPVYGQWKRYWTVGNNLSHLHLPLGIWGMPQLRHLVIHHLCILPHPPDGSNLPLENLQTLFYIMNLVWNEKILQMIPNVRRLGVVYVIEKEFNLHLLKHLHQLEKLEVYGFDRFSWQKQQPAFPTSLKKLTLVGGGFPWEDMSIIGSLPNLQVLKLRSHACKGDTWETAEGEFPELRHLQIKESHLQHWITESSHFPRLKCLMLRSCSHLKEIPQGIGEVPTLEQIEVDSWNESHVESAKQIKEDQESYGNHSLQISMGMSLEEFNLKVEQFIARMNLRKIKQEVMISGNRGK